MSRSTDRSAVWGSCWRDRQGDGCSSMVGTFETRSFWPLVPPLSDEPDAGAMSAASWRRHVGHGVMMLAVGLLLSNRVAAKMKIRMPRIAVRPAAGSHSKSIDFCGGGGGDGRTRVGRGFQCRRDEE